MDATEGENLDDVIAGIQAILKLAAESGNAGERAAAAAAVTRKLTRYNLTLAQVEAASGRQASTGYVAVDHDLGRRAPASLVYVATLLEDFYLVRVAHQSWRIGGVGRVTHESLLFVGRAHNVAVAQHMFVYLTRAFAAAWDDACATAGRRGVRMPRGYRDPVYRGIFENLAGRLGRGRSEAESEAGLVLVADPGLDEAMRAHAPDAEPDPLAAIEDPLEGTLDGAAALALGYDLAGAINLHDAITGGSPADFGGGHALR